MNRQQRIEEVIVRLKAPEGFDKTFRALKIGIMRELRLKKLSLWYDRESDDWYARFLFRHQHAANVAWQRTDCVNELRLKGVVEQQQLPKKEALPDTADVVVPED